MPATPKTCMVGFRTPAGEWVRVVSGESVLEAASKALAFFASDGWYGPQPRSETVLEVSAVGGGRVYRLQCGRVMEWRRLNNGQVEATAQQRINGRIKISLLDLRPLDALSPPDRSGNSDR